LNVGLKVKPALVLGHEQSVASRFCRKTIRTGTSGAVAVSRVILELSMHAKPVKVTIVIARKIPASSAIAPRATGDEAFRLAKREGGSSMTTVAG
jgi:hypothetical protein